MINSGVAERTAVTLAVQPDADQMVPEASEEFVSTSHIQGLTERALAYLDAGYAVHFSGPAGTGKTTLAFHVAALRNRPVTLMHGDDEFSSSDLVGKNSGYRKSKLVDNFIHSVVKTEENMNTIWMANRLTTACQQGCTLIYDEFNRSRPEANNALLSVLEEGILNLSSMRRTGEGYIDVHPEFRAVFTSNPEEYAGVHKTQDALMDRMITIAIGNFDRETEILVATAKSGIGREDAETIVDVVRELRGVGVNNHRPTIRASIAISRILARQHAHARMDDPVFQWVYRDVLHKDTAKVTCAGESLMPKKIEEAVAKVCGSSARRRKPARGPEQATEEKD